MKKNSYIVVTVEENGKYYAYMIKHNNSKNLLYIASIKGILHANICDTKKEAERIAIRKREKELNKEALAGLKLKWLEGEGEKATGNHIAYNNPLNGVSCENCWNNIWEE